MFWLHNITRFYSQKLEDNKKEAKSYYQANKEKLPKISQEFYKILSADEKNKKRNYANIRSNNMSDEDREREKNI